MFDLGLMELLLLAIVAVLVVGPKDLPVMMHTVGRWVGQARDLTRQFQSAIEDAARQSEIDELKKQLAEQSERIEKIGGKEVFVEDYDDDDFDDDPAPRKSDETPS